MITNLLKSLYTKVFINIIIENLQTAVYIEVCSKKEVLQSVRRNFETTTINTKMYDFIQAYAKESPFCYISVLDKSPLQGAVPTCVTSEMGRYCDINSSEYRCFSKDWAFYTSEYDLEAIKYEYRTIGVDFIFSPFVMMANFFRDKIDTTLSMFVLVEDNYLSFTVFDNSKLLYAEYLDMKNHKDDDLHMESPEEDELEGINLEEVNLENDSMVFDDFANIEELDDSDVLDEFSEANEVEQTVEKKVDISHEGFSEDYQRFSLIQSALNTFYKDSKYDGKFVETIYIADGIGVSPDLKSYLEEEMFLSVYVRKIDLCISLCDMAKAEADEI
ncbi:MAG: hypothetical protein PHO62_00365 [Sulfurimonas sp.]|uniref:hypothetical protein n=1 Tax=Sulfurimonas sp. TaxID=2022749 RepID=UPI002612C27B|nr:hypothetical protein [Sulfurimonas sp.]MDD5371862.1 hypothetical protein [Sulfurimonas sp.]